MRIAFDKPLVLTHRRLQNFNPPLTKATHAFEENTFKLKKENSTHKIRRNTYYTFFILLLIPVLNFTIVPGGKYTTLRDSCSCLFTGTILK